MDRKKNKKRRKSDPELDEESEDLDDYEYRQEIPDRFITPGDLTWKGPKE